MHLSLTKPISPFLALVLALLLLPASLPVHAQASDAGDVGILLGRWEGELTFANVTLVLVVTFDEQDGALSASVDIPQQAALGLPASAVSLEDGALHFELFEGARLATFDGAVQEDGSIEGDFSQAGVDGKFGLTRAAAAPAAAAAHAAAEEAPPYQIEEVAVTNGDVTLAGTLTLPPGPGPHPAVVLISGSGAQNRDEEIPAVPGYQPFRVIADHLTRQGIAVLRYDDRGFGQSTGDASLATSADFAEDAEAVFAYLAARPEIDPAQVGLFGHSEGALIGAMIAARNPDVAFLAAMGGSARDGYSIILQQTEDILRASGATEAEITAEIARSKQVLDLILAEDWTALETYLLEVTLAQLDALPDAQKEAIGDLDAFAAAQTAATMQSSRGWMRFFITHDTAADWAQVQAPTLVLLGELDTQVNLQEAQTSLEQAFAKSGNPDAAVQVIPEANHLFQQARTGSPDEYAQLPQEFAPGFITALSDWLLAHVTTAWEAQAAKLEALDATLEQEMEDLGVPGVAIAVVKDGRVLYRKAFGVASIDTGQPLTPDMLFRIGSTTKPVTALALAIAAGDGTVDLDAPIGDVITGLDPALARLTGAQLLSHTAGLKDEGPSFGPHDSTALGETIRSWTADSHVFTEPGEVFSYANPGYALAGLLLQEAAAPEGGSPYHELIDQLVLKPLDMTHSTFQPTQAMTFPFSQGHQAGAGGSALVVRPYPDNAGYWPAGFLITNVDDLARFAMALTGDGKLDSRQVIPAAAVELMTSPHSQVEEGVAYGYGLMLREQRGVRIAEHGGGIEGFTSLFKLAPDHDFAVIVLSNKDGSAFEKTADHAMELLLPLAERAAAEESAAPVVLSQDELERYTGTYSQVEGEGLEVRIKDGQLVATMGGVELPLTPVSAGARGAQFTVLVPGQSVPVSVAFVAGADGTIQYATLGYRALRRE